MVYINRIKEPALRAAWVSIIKSRGFSCMWEKTLDHMVAYIDFDDRELLMGLAQEGSQYDREGTLVSLDELIEKISPKDYVDFYNGDNKVIVRRNGTVTYGCTTVDKETMDRIVEERRKLLTQK